MNFLSKNEVNSVNGGISCNQLFTCEYDADTKELLKGSKIQDNVCPATSDKNDKDARIVNSKFVLNNTTLLINYRINVCD